MYNERRQPFDDKLLKVRVILDMLHEIEEQMEHDDSVSLKNEKSMFGIKLESLVVNGDWPKC